MLPSRSKGVPPPPRIPTHRGPKGGWAAVVAWRKKNEARRLREREDRYRQRADARMQDMRRRLGCVRLYWQPIVPVQNAEGRVILYKGLPGCSVPLVVPELIDAREFIADFKRFVEFWRPMRLRTGPQQAAMQAWWQQWERLGVAAVDPERWKAILPPPRAFGRWKTL